MVDRIVHRGPDGSGVWSDAADEGWSVSLGHRRLSIIDLDGGAQPMRDAATGVTVSYNGEIYNFKPLRKRLADRGHVFRSQSDTEVLLRAYLEYGDRCVDQLQGMFAFAIWDPRNQHLMLARDRVGKKPLFYHADETSIVFASELKALHIETPRLNDNAVWDYLVYRYVPGPQTLFEGVYKLPAGCVATWKAGALDIRRYYELPDERPRRSAASVAESTLR